MTKVTWECGLFRPKHDEPHSQRKDCSLELHMIWLIIGLVLVSLLIFVMVTPLIIEVDTESEVPVSVRWKGIMRMQLLLRDDEPEFEWFILGFRIKLGRKKKKPVEKVEKKPRKGFSLRKGLQLLRTFRIRRLDWDLDTGNFSTNAKLWPIFWFLSRKQYHLRVNFMGQNRLRFLIDNRLYRILGALMKK